MESLNWYSAGCIFAQKRPGERNNFYEERIVLLRCPSLDAAVQAGEAEANKYAASLDGVTFLGYVDAYDICEDKMGEGVEVYSIIREDPLPPDEFMKHETAL